MSRRTFWLAVTGWLALGYAGLVVSNVGIGTFWGIALVCLPLWVLAFARLSSSVAPRVALLAATTLFSLLLLDAAYSAWRIASAPADDLRDREGDVFAWQGEVMPRRYYPTERNFMRYKPDVRVRAALHGEAYNVDGPLLLRSPQAAAVLDRRVTEYAIDRHGFRSPVAPESARIFALGDSYVFGDRVDVEAIWHQRLGARLGEPVYNLGVSDTSPTQQWLLLEHLFETEPGTFAPRVVLWMLFEGNDLEDSHAPLRWRARTSPLSTWLSTTPVGVLAVGLPRAVRESSVIHGLLYGPLFVRGLDASVVEPQSIDGVPLRTRIYTSPRHGVKIVPYPEYIERATRSKRYVDTHPNRKALSTAIAGMAALAEAHHFELMVVLAPAFPRIHGRGFDGFPEPSERAWLLESIAAEAGERGLESVDLVPDLSAIADDVLLYQRDDSHWTEDAHARVAGIVARALSERIHGALH